MRIRGHGNSVAIALAGLAVVMAASGTAYAVASSRVNIADRDTPSHVAHVDRYGRLAVAGSVTGKVGVTGKVAVTGVPVAKASLTTVNVFTFVSVQAYAAVTSPTTATLAVTSLGYDNSANTPIANTDFQVGLYKLPVSGGVCDSTGGAATVRYRQEGLLRGQSVSTTFPSPLAFVPTGGKPYCIGVYVHPVDSSTAPVYYSPSVSLGATVVNGTYSGVGSAATPATVYRPQLRTVHTR